MPTPVEHALLSASSAARWLNCTAAPRFEAGFPETSSDYAKEGSLAHAVCELKVIRHFTTRLSAQAYTARLEALKKEPHYSEEMDKTADRYLEHLIEKAMSYPTAPTVAAEVRVDFSDYVPHGFGTCDCVMIGGDTLNIVDYKHGKGVPVSAQNNAQMRLYALGALRRYAAIYGDTIQQVSMTICQPRIRDEPDSETLTVKELLAFGERVKPIAAKAYMGLGEFVPGEHCRFCRGKVHCKARADSFTALEEFKNCVPGEKLTDEEIGDLLLRGEGLAKWYNDLKDYALSAALQGKTVPGWKVVAGRSCRSFTDQDKAIKAVLAAGYDEALVYERHPKTLTEIERLMGKKAFADTLGDLITKAPGRPTLVQMNDKREPYSAAAADFSGIIK